MKANADENKVRSKASSGRKRSPAAAAAPADRSEHIAVAAYYKAQARGFAPGCELEDWLQAEKEVARQPGPL